MQSARFPMVLHHTSESSTRRIMVTVVAELHVIIVHIWACACGFMNPNELSKQYRFCGCSGNVAASVLSSFVK